MLQVCSVPKRDYHYFKKQTFNEELSGAALALRRALAQGWTKFSTVEWYP